METETKPLWTTTREAMGKTWTIGLCPDDVALHKKGGNFGKAYFAAQEININVRLPIDTRDQTLLHEILHMVSDELDLDLSEPGVLAAGAFLYAFLRGFGLWNGFPWPDKEKR